MSSEIQTGQLTHTGNAVQPQDGNSDDLAIRVDDVVKHYVMFDRSEDRLKQMVIPRIQRLFGRPAKRYFEVFSAVGGISFTVKRGETVGIVGRNGSGKSTTLQMICGTLQPTAGSIKVNGRIAALLELGAGFNPEFTGRENVYLNAAILGLSHDEIDARFEDIARFADIGRFIDQPVKTYSSGMYVRLAFAVAINVDPDILIIDEALAVGDEAFQRKCFARIEDIKHRGATILFVSHSAQSIVQLCDRALLFDRGEMILDGRPKTVVNQYQRFVNLIGDEAEPVREQIKAMDGWAKAEPKPEAGADPLETANPQGGVEAAVEPALSEDESWFDPNLAAEPVEYDSQGAEIFDLKIVNLAGQRVNNLTPGKRYALEYRVKFSAEAGKTVFGMQVKTINGYVLAGANNLRASETRLLNAQPGSDFSMRFEFDCRFLQGTYMLDVGVMAWSDGDYRFMHRIMDAIMFRVSEEVEVLPVGHFDLRPKITIETSDQGQVVRLQSNKKYSEL